MYVGYFQSWSETKVSKGANAGLAKLPPYVNVVPLSFLSPNARYTGDYDISKCGLDFPYDGSILKQAISTLKSKNPDTKVMISVGGAGATGWDSLSPQDIANFVKDFDLDGVDVDFEPSNPNCSNNNGQITCASDSKYISIVSSIRAVLPRPYYVSIAGWSIGAYGEGNFTNAQPHGSYTGMAIGLLKSSTAQDIDWINVMAYDAGTTYQPEQAYLAYKSFFPGKVTLGVEVPPEAWGGHNLTMSELSGLISFINQNDGDGMMIWSLQDNPNSTPNPTTISQAICNGFGLPDCTADLGV